MEKNSRLTSAEIALARLREMANDVGRSKTESVDQAPEKPLRAIVRDLDIASDLLEAGENGLRRPPAQREQPSADTSLGR